MLTTVQGFFKKKENINYFIFCILPLFYLLILFIITEPEKFLYYLNTVDPEYAYLFSGLNFSQLHFKIAHIDHPGTPLQLLICIVIWLLDLLLINKKGIDIILDNPELVLHLVFYILNLGIVLSIYIMGIKIYTFTRNYLLTLFFQLIPLVIVMKFNILHRVIPENMQIIALTLLILYIIYYYQITTPKIKHNICLALIIAFVISLKISTIPLLAIPIIIIPKILDKLKYTGLSVVFFHIIAFPVIQRLDYFYNTWIKSIITHAGSYGKGANKIIDPDVFFDRIVILGKYYLPFTFIFLFGLIVVFLMLLSKYRKEKSVSYLLTIIVIIISNTIMTAKHFGYKYWLISITMLPLLIYFLIECISLVFPRYKKQCNYCVYALLLIITLSTLIQNYNHHKKLIVFNKNQETVAFIEKNIEAENCIIISPDYYGCSFKQYSLLFGYFCVRGKYRPEIRPHLVKRYPNTYQYFNWEDNIHFWDYNNVLSEDILTGHKEAYIYLNKDNKDELNKIIKKIASDYNINIVEAFKNHQSKEAIYKLYIDSST